MSEPPKRRKDTVLVVSDAPKLKKLGGVTVRSADAYLEGAPGTEDTGVTVINLCRSYEYLSKGYYVSLLAEARHQRVVPALNTIAALVDPFVYFRALEEAGVDTIDYKIVRGGRRLLPRAIVVDTDRALVDSGGDIPHFERSQQPFVDVTAVLGKTLDDRFHRPIARVHRTFPVPLLKVRFYRDEDDERWVVGQIYPAAVPDLTTAERALLAKELGREPRSQPRAATPRPARIACLWDEHDPYAPSDEETLEKFERAAERQGALFEVIEKDDLPTLAEYDALLIRTVTGVDHYAFTFARTAESLDIPVIDDPASIMRCSNKVFLHELFDKHGIPTPRTVIVSRKSARDEIGALGFPLIVKLPDGTFSHAVKKAANREAFDAIAHEMFKKSPLLIVQEFIPTPFDWRIGTLEGSVLFAAKYHMARDHWQIVGRTKTGRARYGKVEAVPIDEVPEAVRRTALEAATLIGNGLYGVDVKDTPAGPLVIEVNDNPNILETDEDAIERDRLYDAVITALLRRTRSADPTT